MSSLYRILRRFNHRYRGVVILTLTVILLTLATPMRAHAAAQNHATAQYNLAVLYSNGSGVKRDYEAALALLLIARRQPGLSAAGQRQIGQLMAKIQAQLNSTQIGRAEWQAAQIIGSDI